MANENNAKEESKLVSWFLNRKGLLKREGKNGEFYQARVFKGTTLPNGKDISGYTYTFDVGKLKDIKVYENSPDFIKDEDFRNNNGVIYYKEETKIKLTEPYDKDNPEKELATIILDAKDLAYYQMNKDTIRENLGLKDTDRKDINASTKERITQRAVEASESKSDIQTICSDTLKPWTYHIV